MTVMMLVMLALFTGATLGVLAVRYFVVMPLWETEAALRKELKHLRGALWTKSNELYNLRWFLTQNSIRVEIWHTPEGKISHRGHSDVLPFDSIDDLIEGTKP